MNRNELIKLGANKIMERTTGDYFNVNDLEDIDYIHDVLLEVKIDGVRIEDDDDLHDQMVELLDEDLRAEIVKPVEDEMDYYYGIQAGYDAYYSDRL